MAVKTVEIDNLINGQLYGFRMFPRNLKGQYQTRDDRGTATATPVAFSLPTYTGQHAIFGDINEGRIEMYTSGTLTLSPATYDMFVVGGGGGTWRVSTMLNGGGGGYTNTIKNHTIESIFVLSTYIGSGSSNNGSVTKIGNIISAEGGKNGVFDKGDGGSGGGSSNASNSSGGYNGGSDGSDGGGSGGGTGQHTTTRAFGEPTGTLYAGGGGGGSNFDNRGGSGGAGGGGDGGDTVRSGKNGTPNTGGGAGVTSGYVESADATHLGGSGIAIVRLKRN